MFMTVAAVVQSCPEVKKESEPEKPSKFEIQSYFVVPQKGLPLNDISLGDKTISALIDSGSSVNLIREYVSTKSVDQQKYSKKCNILSRIGKLHVLTKGTFKHNFFIDEDHHSLTWHVVPTKHLNFEAIIDTNILEQDSSKFTEEDSSSKI
ncbi:peptidase A2 domain-containing protein [Nephila pilipes]|uniref:Peptidase A2 domain-containing protein n=1 Tax=Nephila pilipes TaxID=299642 RepID=A0A8X6P7K7_NEPPI|nr:peptidase A2 domain-containing protein [Nephila pilipes]